MKFNYHKSPATALTKIILGGGYRTAKNSYTRDKPSPELHLEEQERGVRRYICKYNCKITQSTNLQ